MSRFRRTFLLLLSALVVTSLAAGLTLAAGSVACHECDPQFVDCIIAADVSKEQCEGFVRGLYILCLPQCSQEWDEGFDFCFDEYVEDVEACQSAERDCSATCFECEEEGGGD